jgi:acetyl-CoA acetyltransferase
MWMLSQLKTVFRPEGEGVVTAGNSSQLTDWASAVLVGDREVAEADGLVPRARFLARVAVGEDPVMQLTGVILVTRLVLK